MFLFNRFKHNKNPGYRPELDRVTVTDIEYGSVEPELEYPKEFLPLDNPIPDYQNGQGECTLQGVSYAIRLWSKKLYNKDWNPSEAYLYAMSEKKEMEDFHRDYPTPGGWIKNGLSVAQHNGVCEEKYWNPEKRQSFETYVDWKKLPLEAHENAKEHKIGLWARVDYSIQIK